MNAKVGSENTGYETSMGKEGVGEEMTTVNGSQTCALKMV